MDYKNRHIVEHDRNTLKRRIIPKEILVQDVATAIRAEEALHEALMHFDLLDLEEIGLQDDAFLMEHWQSRRNRKHFPSHRDHQDDEPREEEESGRDMPDRVKLYIRQKSREAREKHSAAHTAGATLPEISNPDALSAWKSMAASGVARRTSLELQGRAVLAKDGRIPLRNGKTTDKD